MKLSRQTFAENALARATAEAQRLGYTNIQHIQADLNVDTISGRFDFVIAEGVLHHIENLARCLQMVRSVMPLHGIFVAAEFTGPFRFQLPDEQIYWINQVLKLLPRGVRFGLTGTADDLLPAGDFDPYVRPTEESIVRFDPSEAISGYFLDPLLLSIFDVIERKELGGTLMTYLHEHVDYRLAGGHPYNMWTELAIDLESALIERGIVKSDYVFYVLRKHAATSPPSTLTDALTKRDDNPLWNLESLGSVTVNEAKSQPFELLREPLVAIRGWAIDWIAKSAAGGAEIVIDGNVYAGQYGLRRRDIAEVYRGLEYLDE